MEGQVEKTITVGELRWNFYGNWRFYCMCIGTDFCVVQKDNYLNFTLLISIFFKLSKSSQIILVYFNFSFQDM